MLSLVNPSNFKVKPYYSGENEKGGAGRSRLRSDCFYFEDFSAAAFIPAMRPKMIALEAAVPVM